MLACPRCPNRSFKDDMALQQHTKTCKHRTSCPHCNKGLKSQKALQEHIDEIHLTYNGSQNAKSRCKHCDLVFENEKTWKAHQKTHPITCHECHRAFKSEAARLQHEVAKHISAHNPKCPFCHMVFSNMDLLLAHQQYHVTKCCYCANDFGTQLSTAVHEQSCAYNPTGKVNRLITIIPLDHPTSKPSSSSSELETMETGEGSSTAIVMTRIYDADVSESSSDSTLDEGEIFHPTGGISSSVVVGDGTTIEGPCRPVHSHEPISCSVVVCWECDSVVDETDSLELHYTESPAHPSCAICGVGTKDLNTMNEHIRHLHSAVAMPNRLESGDPNAGPDEGSSLIEKEPSREDQGAVKPPSDQSGPVPPLPAMESIVPLSVPCNEARISPSRVKPSLLLSPQLPVPAQAEHISARPTEGAYVINEEQPPHGMDVDACHCNSPSSSEHGSDVSRVQVHPTSITTAIIAEEAKKLAQDLMKHGLNVSIADLEDLSRDWLIRQHIKQIEKERKALNGRLQIAVKRIDHIERAYRREEYPLLAQAYAKQQATDRATFEELQKVRIENSLAMHNQALVTKKRLGRMEDEFRVHRETLLVARSEDYQRRKAIAEQKMEEEKEVRRQAHLAHLEAERKQREEEEAAAHLAKEQQLRAEAEQKHQEEEQAAEQRRQREGERAAVMEEARKKAQREAEAEERARLRSQTKAAPGPTALPHSRRVWRSRTQPQARASEPVCSGSPAASPLGTAATGPPKIGTSRGWRQREAEKKMDLGVRAESPNVTSSALLDKKDADKYETVPEKKGVWRSRRVQNQS